ncbi:unnamed protein product [Mytilus coruscus]|uniref:Uncharacterized protein n=1 Tax=Mytilus coruscus TaxID=42192 RepID=A0A6J8AKW7_MYTCO|nr:unnamed protein product [Mytilus coruscus]
MKGYSLTTQTMRTMNEHILEECNARGIDIVCTCFDGQWIKLATRDVDERPLTLLQLQRDVYETASKEKRNTILKHLSEKPIADDLENDVCAIRNESGGLNVTSELLRKVFQAIHYTTKSQNVTKRDLESKQDKVQSDGSLSCLPDEALEVLIESENLISCEDDVAPLDDNETTDTNEPDTTQNASANVLEDSTVRTSLMSDDTVTEILCKFKEHQKKQYQRKAAFPIRKSWKILDKANAVSKLIGSGIQKERTVKRMVSLKESALKVVQNNTRYVPKSKLNNVYAVTLYKDSYRSWISKSPFNETTEVEGVGHVKWFSYPEVSEKRNKMEPKCLDAHHLLVNLRVKNNAFALRTFSTDVESEMRKLGFIREADFCKLIREWYEAEDESGISAVDRMKRRINLKSFLLEGVDFGRYPMYGMYVKGFPKVQFEGFLQRIDTSLQLYSVVKNGSFNQRAISSLANETFFGELSEMEPTKLGCPKAVNIPRLMSTVTELHHFRSNPNDSEHAFDRAKRKRKKRVTKRSDVSMPNQVARGCMPIRFHHKCDESKVLPTTRLGIDMKDPSAV